MSQSCNLCRRHVVLLWAAALALISSLAMAADRQVEVLTTAHYRIRSDLDPALTRSLGQRLDALFDEYARRFEGLRPHATAPRLEVRLFSRREDYLALTAGKAATSGGLFSPSHHVLAAFLEGQGRDGLQQTLQHEAFHQFAAEISGSLLPPWLNEGMAQVFEEGLWFGPRFVVGQVPPYRVRQLHADIQAGRLIDFRSFMALSDDAWVGGFKDDDRPELQYNQAWAMAHFLIYATDERGQPKYRERLMRLLQMTGRRVDGSEAFRAAFSDNIKGFQDRFTEYAATLQATEEARWVENQRLLAGLLIVFHERGRDFRDIDEFRDAAAAIRLRYERGAVVGGEEPAATFFCADDGRVFDPDELYLEQRSGPLPDLVCVRSSKLRIRTQFHQDGSHLNYQTICEPRQ